MSRLAYLGPAGTFSETAALRYQPSADLVPCASEAAVAAAVSSGSADAAILAIENSLEGSVTGTLDALIHEATLAISHELILPIEQCLIVRPGVTAPEVKVIRSHPQALHQCRMFIDRRFPHARQEASLSTAGAVKEILEIEGGAAIGPARAAELHSAEVLERGIEDDRHNKTRFVALDKTDSEPTGDDKTSIALTVAHDRPGTLVNVLHQFSDRGINLTKIESRPSRQELGIYIFLVDLEGHRSDAPVSEALAAVEAQAFFFRVFGSYPRFRDA